jgi:hypothetical protein
LRGLLPLTLTLSCWRLLSRQVPSMRVIGLLFVLGIDLTYLGLAGWAAPPLFSADWLAFLVGGAPATLGLALAHLWPPLVVTGIAIALLLARQKVDGGKRLVL